jgi:ketosteroid isomerase-like protein
MEVPMSDQTTLDHDDVIALERAYWDAMKAKDGKTTEKLSGETSLVTGMRGVMSIAKAKMGAMTEEGGWALHSYAFEDVAVVTPAPNVAIIAYKVRQSVTMDGKKAEIHAADSSTWVKGPDGWACYAHSENMLDDKKAA